MQSKQLLVSRSKNESFLRVMLSTISRLNLRTASKMAATRADTYTLHYWPTIPGRGEYVRLALVAAGLQWKENNDPGSLTSLLDKEKHFAVPVLEVRPPFPRPGGQEGDVNMETQVSKSFHQKPVTISQTPAILHYLAMVHELDGVDHNQDDALPPELQRAHLNQVTLTILDLSNEAHDTHHPIAAGLYYEDQKAEAKRRADDFRGNRIPKFFAHFDSLLSSNGGGYLIRKGHLTTADLALWQVLDGLHFMFPKLMNKLAQSGDYKTLFEFYDALPKREKKVGEYLKSDKRLPYSNGLFRKYPELDEQ